MKRSKTSKSTSAAAAEPIEPIMRQVEKATPKTSHCSELKPEKEKDLVSAESEVEPTFAPKPEKCLA